MVGCSFPIQKRGSGLAAGSASSVAGRGGFMHPALKKQKHQKLSASKVFWSFM
jgi:translation initiation factor 6 (eIF-6)